LHARFFNCIRQVAKDNFSTSGGATTIPKAMDTSACTSTSQFVGQSSVPPTSVTHLLVVPSNELLINAALVHEMKPDNIARGVWKIEKKEKDAIFEARQIVGQKLHKIVIRPRDGINRGCNGKNAWEEAVRILIP